MRISKKKYITYLGCPGFPYGLAEMQKTILISKCLVLTGNEVTVISNKGFHNYKEHPDLKASGKYENIEFVYTSGTPYYSNSFIRRNILKLKGALNEIVLLKKKGKAKNLDFAIISTNSFSTVLYYVLISKIIGFRTILNHVEYYSSMKKKWYKIGQRMNANLLDNVAPKIVDGLFTISEFLISKLKVVAPHKPYLKIPVLTEFERYNETDISEAEKYFLFCGSASYREIIEFIIDSFALLENEDVFLYLVINGSEKAIKDVQDYINSSTKKNNIKFFTKLSQKELYNKYKNAKGLLIPLRPTFQDSARFPHKFGEYLASGNPVITTNYGEVKFYFEDMKNMIIAEEYDLNKFAEKMQFVVNNDKIAKEIGIRGKEIAGRIFDYQNRAKEIDQFLNSF